MENFRGLQFSFPARKEKEEKKKKGGLGQKGVLQPCLFLTDDRQAGHTLTTHNDVGVLIRPDESAALARQMQIRKS